MQLPDEAIVYDYQNLLAPPMDAWTPSAEMRAKHFLSQARLRDFIQKLPQIRGQIVAERELKNLPPEMTPLHAGFIDYPQRLLDQNRRNSEKSVLGRIIAAADRLKAEVDRVVVLGIGGSYLGAKALFDALRSPYHNELPHKDRPGIPRIYFEGNNVDNDALAELFSMLQNTCVDPDLREERWGVVVISKSGGTIETSACYRAIRKEMAEFYGNDLGELRKYIVPITGATGKFRDLCEAEGFEADSILPIPDDVGGRYSVFTPVGLLPAAVMGLDVRALLLGAAAMTKRFIEEPFDRNPVLQYAAVNHLMTTEYQKPIRVMSVWSKKLESLGLWHDQLLAESLGKTGTGATPITAVQTRDLHSRGQQHQEGSRDKLINNVVVRGWNEPPITITMQDRNEDDLNQYNRKGLPDLMQAALLGTNQAYWDVARPTADLILPSLSEHTIGQVMQMLMLATLVEGRLMGVNPYGQPGVEAYKANMKQVLKG